MTEKLPFEFFLNPLYSENPYEVYAGLRERGPVHPIDFPPGSDAFVVVDHEHGRAALSDPRLSKQMGESAPAWLRKGGVRGNPLFASNMLTCDPPDHTRLRRLLAKAFTSRRVEELRPRVTQVTQELLAAFQGRSEAELIGEFAFPLPIIVICELMGIPAEDRDDFRVWSGVLVTPAIEEDQRRAREETIDATFAYFTKLIERRRADPREDLISALVTARDQEGLLSTDELLSTLVLMLVAGHETTVNLIGNGMLALLRHPAQLALLRERPDLLPGAVEEFLRYDAPVQRGTFRIAVEDMEIAGTPIPRGAFVHVCIGATGRDPAVFEDPDRLDITREDSRHVAFGHGIHFCLGAPLARMEGRIAFGALLSAMPGVRLAVPVEELRWRLNGSVVRGLAELPVRF
jgi:cytochrome P450